LADSVYGIESAWKESGFDGKNQCWLKGIMFPWNKSGLVGRYQVSMEEIRFGWKESGFASCVVNME
jgi:hypothetical protein